MDLRLEVQPIVQEYLTAREEDAAWMRGPWNADRQAAYERLLSYVCRKFSEPFLRNGQWREWAENRPAVARAVRELVRLSGEQQ